MAIIWRSPSLLNKNVFVFDLKSKRTRSICPMIQIELKTTDVERPLRLLVMRVLPGVTLLCVAAINLGCSGSESRPAGPNASQTTTLVISKPIDHVDLKAREPMIVQHPDGTLFVSGYGESTPTLWKSADRGASWARINLGTESDGAVGNSDVDLAVARDGTLYFVTMYFDRKTNEGTQINLGVSKDLGASWSWTLLSKSRFDDRPWWRSPRTALLTLSGTTVAASHTRRARTAEQLGTSDREFTHKVDQVI